MSVNLTGAADGGKLPMSRKYLDNNVRTWVAGVGSRQS